MADFSIPFGRDSERRLPSSTERTEGFPCGPASQPLFNGLLHRVESEIGEVISFFGITPSDDRYTQLREAIESGIAAATGTADTSQYLLVSQARTRLPIFPEIVSADGKINVSSPAAGIIRVPGNIQFMHRGIFPVTTSETDFNTDISKTYHLRWNPTDGLSLNDIASSTYNPNTLTEENIAFDSSYDDMLIARIVTNSSNVATITNLVNFDRMWFNGVLSAVDWTDPATNIAFARMQQTLDWSRTPQFKSFSQATKAYNKGTSSVGDHDEYIRYDRGVSGAAGSFPVNRYETHFSIGRDFVTSLRMDVSFGA